MPEDTKPAEALPTDAVPTPATQLPPTNMAPEATPTEPQPETAPESAQVIETESGSAEEPAPVFKGGDEGLGFIPDRNNPGELIPLTHAELDRRMEDIKSGRAKTIPADQVHAEVRRIAAGESTVDEVLHEIDQRTQPVPEAVPQASAGLASTVTEIVRDVKAVATSVAELIYDLDKAVHVLVRPGAEVHTVRRVLDAKSFDEAVVEARKILQLDDNDIDPHGVRWSIQ